MIRETTFKDYRDRIRRVLRHIEDHLDAPLELTALARIACFSPYHFHRVFRGMVGESVAEHVRRLRLERAAGWLKNSRRSVTRIAFEAGYETHESFIRAFRGRFGMVPSEWRRSRKHTPDAANGASGSVSRSQGENQMDVQVKQFPRVRVAAVRHTGPYAECGKAWSAVCGWAGRKGLLGPATRFIGVSYDDPEVTPAEKIRYDACISIGPDVEAEGDVIIQEIGGAEYASTTHKGPYERLNETYAHVCGVWGPQSGREFQHAPCIEVYLNDPERTPPDQLRTEIYIPLVPRR